MALTSEHQMQLIEKKHKPSSSINNLYLPLTCFDYLEDEDIWWKHNILRI